MSSYKGFIVWCTPGGATLWYKLNDVATTYLWSSCPWVQGQLQQMLKEPCCLSGMHCESFSILNNNILFHITSLEQNSDMRLFFTLWQVWYAFEMYKIFQRHKISSFQQTFYIFCDRVLYQSVNCPLYIPLTIKYDIYKGVHPRSCEAINADWPASWALRLLFHKHELVKRPCIKTRLTSDLMRTQKAFFW